MSRLSSESFNDFNRLQKTTNFVQSTTIPPKSRTCLHAETVDRAQTATLHMATTTASRNRNSVTKLASLISGKFYQINIIVNCVIHVLSKN